jgi:acyl-CoA reductase-like NAD-dependent aldehyde dehydrogenase
VRELKVGGDDGHLGAMTSPAQVAIVKDHLDDAVAKGAKVLTGGPTRSAAATSSRPCSRTSITA